jgi:hypothetical protein
MPDLLTSYASLLIVVAGVIFLLFNTPAARLERAHRRRAKDQRRYFEVREARPQEERERAQIEPVR